MNAIRMPVEGPFKTKQALVVQSLREAIQSARLIPGERLVIDEIARVLQVSPIPVREALRQLQSERLVELRPHVGAVVTSVSPEEAREIFALLEGLELACARAACSRVAEADLEALAAEAAAMPAAWERGDDARWAALNARFHQALPRIAAMPRAAEMMARVWNDWERLRTLRFRDAPRGDGLQAQREHLAMIEALRRRDAEALEALARAHNRAAVACYLP